MRRPNLRVVPIAGLCVALVVACGDDGAKTSDTRPDTTTDATSGGDGTTTSYPSWDDPAWSEPAPPTTAVVAAHVSAIRTAAAVDLDADVEFDAGVAGPSGTGIKGAPGICGGWEADAPARESAAEGMAIEATPDGP